MSNVGILAHQQEISARARTHVPRDIADEMLRRMVVERITSKLYRMLPPDSVFPGKASIAPAKQYIPSKLPPREVAGCWFQIPQSDTWKLQHRTVTFYDPR